MALVYVLLLTSSAGAQASLQSGSGGLQPQLGQAQDSLNTQKETGTVQDNNGTSLLSQNGNRPLGVVSSPNQTTPDAIVTPSSTLKTDLSPKPEDNSGRNRVLIAAGLFIIGLVVVTYNFRVRPVITIRDKSTAPTPDPPIIKPEPVKPKSKAAKKRKAGKSKKKKKR